MYIRLIIFLIIPALFISTQAAGQDTVTIGSVNLPENPSALVFLPESYDRGTTRYPVVYLLHGWSGRYRDWSDHVDLKKYVDLYQYIIVCPDGGYAGWYLDSPLKNESQYATYIAVEVIAFIDSTYRTISGPEGRAICGLSMGGHGAVSLLCNFPDRFCVAASLSGVMNLSTTSAEKFGLNQLIGYYQSNQDLWEAYSCTNAVQNLQNHQKGLILDCGVDDKLCISSNRRLHQTLIDLKIDHDYYERPGGHSWSYWVNALPYHLLYISNYFKEN